MNTQAIGDYIREKRIIKGWTQEELAGQTDVSPKTVSNWENGKFSYFKNDNLERISQALHISIAELYMAKDLTELDEDTKKELDSKIKELNVHVGEIQNITVEIGDRNLISLDIAISAFGVAIIAFSLAMWSAFSHTIVCGISSMVLALFGVCFLIFGKQVIRKVDAKYRIRKEEIENNYQKRHED